MSLDNIALGPGTHNVVDAASFAKVLASYAVKKVNVKDRVATAMSKMVVQTIDNLSDAQIKAATQKIASGVASQLTSEEGRKIIEDAMAEMITLSAKGCVQYYKDLGQVWFKRDIISRTLMQGLMYARILNEPAALSILCGFLFADVMEIPQVPAALMVRVIHELYFWMTSKRTPSLKVQGPSDGKSKDGPDEVEEALTAIWQTISAVHGYVGSRPKTLTQSLSTIIKQMDTQAKAHRNVLSFFGTICRVVHRLYVYIVDKVYGVSAASRLLYQDDHIMKTWADETQQLLDPANEKLVVDNREWFNRLVSCHMVGRYFIREIMRAGVKDVPPGLLQTQKAVANLLQKAQNLGIATSFRPEPVCVWIAGPPGVGKTYMKDKMVRAMLQASGTPLTGNDTFTVNCAQKHWTGAENKAVVYYDDFGTVDDPTFLGEGVGQFMQLISDSRFSPPQAAVEDKGKPVAPVLVYVNSNEKTPVYHGVRNTVAFWRRRHICVEVVRTEMFARAFGQEGNLETPGAREWLQRHKSDTDCMPHIKFHFFDPITGAIEGEAMQFEQFKSALTVKFCDRHDENHQKYRAKFHEAVNGATYQTSTPLVEILADIERRALIVVPEANSFKEYFRSRYTRGVSWLSGSVEMARSWLADIGGLVRQPLQTQAAAECECPNSLYRDLVLNHENKLVWNRMDRNGEVYTYACASPTCLLKSDAWIAKVKRMAAQDLTVDVPMIVELLQVTSGSVLTIGSTGPRTASVSTDVASLVTQATAEVQTVDLPEKIKYTSLALAAVAGAIGTCACAKYLGSFVLPSGTRTTLDMVAPPPAPRASVVGQLLSSGDNITTRKQTKKSTVGLRKTLVAQSTGGDDVPVAPVALTTQCSESYQAMLNKAICFIGLSGVDRASNTEFSGFPFRVFGLCDRWVLVPKHYQLKVQRTADPTFTFTSGNASLILVEVTIEEVQELQDSELCMWRLSNNVPAFKDMRKHIIDEKAASRITNRGYLYERVLGSAPTLHPISLRLNSEVKYTDTGNDATYILPQAYEYDWEAPGRCMTPLLCTLDRTFIIGFHVIGGDQAITGKGRPTGCAEPICRETFEVLEKLSPDGLLSAATVLECQGYSSSAKPGLALHTNVEILGCVAPAYSAQSPPKSGIVPSAIHQYVECTTRPAPLCPDDVDGEFSPLRSGVEKHGQPPKLFPKELLTQAETALRDQYLTACKPIRAEVGVLSEEDAVRGFPGIDGYQGMDLSTSEGYPWVATRPPGESNKRYLVSVDATEDTVTIDPKVLETMRTNDQRRSKGVVPMTVFTDCLKDARIAIKKFRVPGKTRVFSVSPIDFTIQFRMYFLDLLAAMKVNRLELEHAVGINIHSIEWTQLAHRVTATGQNMLCGDYSNFGPGLSAQVVEAVARVWCDWYKYHETKQGVDPCEVKRRYTVRRVMMEELRHSVHLCRNILYRAPCGSPSGAPCTVNLNNDVNKLYVYMAWIACFKENPIMSTIVSFRKHVRLYVYGDDLLAGVADNVIGVFNNEYLQHFLAKYDIKYTDETKEGTIRSFVPFAEASFLKCRWRKHDTRSNVLTSAQDLSSVLEIPNWCRKSSDRFAATREAMCQSLMIMFGHGKEAFNEHRQRLISAWADRGDSTPLTLYTWEEMDAMRFGFAEGSEVNYDTIDTLVEKERRWREGNAREAVAAYGMQSLWVELD